jgi:hypothetical protein
MGYNCAQHYYLLLLQLQLMTCQSQLDSLLGYHPPGFGHDQYTAVKASKGIYVLYDYITDHENPETLRPGSATRRTGHLKRSRSSRPEPSRRPPKMETGPSPLGSVGSSASEASALLYAIASFTACAHSSHAPRQILGGSVRQSVQRRSTLGHPHRCGLLLHAHDKQHAHPIHGKSLVNGRQTLGCPRQFLTP